MRRDAKRFDPKIGALVQTRMSEAAMKDVRKLADQKGQTIALWLRQILLQKIARTKASEKRAKAKTPKGVEKEGDAWQRALRRATDARQAWISTFQPGVVQLNGVVSMGPLMATRMTDHAFQATEEAEAAATEAWRAYREALAARGIK